MDAQHEEDALITKLRVKCHHQLIILHEILNDVLQFKELRQPDSAKDYKEKLGLINERREMIKYLNTKYGSASRLFLDVLALFKDDPHKMLHVPHP